MHTQKSAVTGVFELQMDHLVHTKNGAAAMAIHVFCTKCKTSNGLEAKACSKCGASFRRDKKYRVCVSVKGERVTRVCDNLTIAREVETTLKSDLIRGQLDLHKPKSVPSLDQLWEKYFPWAKEHKKTWRNDQYQYEKHLKPRFGSKRLDTISPMDIEAMKLGLRQSLNRIGKPYSNATIKHLLVLLNRLFNIARKWDLFAGENPLDQVDKPKLDNQKTEFLTKDQVDSLQKVLLNWHCRESAAFVEFSLLTGFRRGELFKLAWNDIDFEKGRVTLRGPKPGKTFTVPISDEALLVLKRLNRSSDFVFPGKDGKQRVDFKGPWMKIRKAAGLPEDFRFQGLRHNFASHLVSNGEDLYTVGKLLGHRNTSTTQRYAHLADERLRQAAVKSGSILGQGMKGASNGREETSEKETEQQVVS